MDNRKIQINKELDSQQKLAKHVADLHLGSIRQYKQWCIKHGFDTSLKKRNKVLASERAYAAELARKAIAERTRRSRRSTKDALLGLADGSLRWQDCVKPQHQNFGKLIDLLRRSDYSFQRGSLVQLLNHLLAVRSKILKDSEAKSKLGDGNSISLIETIVLIAAYRRHWIRPLDQWKPRTRNPRRQLRSLLRHLFDQYDEVPQFMDQAWTVTIDRGGSLDQTFQKMRQWYLHLGRGQNLRELDLTIPYTKKMAYYFCRAPKELTIVQALRWGQAMGLKGSERLSTAIASSRLSDDLENDDFWLPVIRWLVSQPMLDCAQVGPMLDYIHNQRFVNERRIGPGGMVMAPAEPNFTIKGRTVDSLMRQVEKWHQQLANTNRIQVKSWYPSGIRAFEFAEGSEKSESHKVWTIRELLSARSLITEGRQLRHCVASYANSCSRGFTSIWTLEVSTKEGFQKLVTLEVRLSNQTIVQARGKSNRLMTEKERSIVNRWASAADLQISPYL